MIHATISRKNLRARKCLFSDDKTVDAHKRKVALQKLAAVLLKFRNQ